MILILENKNHPWKSPSKKSPPYRQDPQLQKTSEIF